VLHLRDVVGDAEAIDARLAAIAAQGVPNYFGEQRFGRDGGNLAAARAMFAGRRVPRDKRSILLSAARSEIFNAVLAQRVARGDWARGLSGEVWMLDGSHSVFGPVPMDATLEQRCTALDIHPTGPLWGAGELRSAEAVRALEAEAAQASADLAAGLEQAGLRQERRALRLPVANLAWARPAPDVLQLEFFLPAGTYATTVLHALGEIDSQPGAVPVSSENE
jgi:tRNA pseudouridine13 synthase